MRGDASPASLPRRSTRSTEQRPSSCIRAAMRERTACAVAICTAIRARTQHARAGSERASRRGAESSVTLGAHRRRRSGALAWALCSGAISCGRLRVHGHEGTRLRLRRRSASFASCVTFVRKLGVGPGGCLGATGPPATHPSQGDPPRINNGYSDQSGHLTSHSLSSYCIRYHGSSRMLCRVRVWGTALFRCMEEAPSRWVSAFIEGPVSRIWQYDLNYWSIIGPEQCL